MRPSAISFVLASASCLAAFGASPARGQGQAGAVLSADSFRHYIDGFNANDVEVYPTDIDNASAWGFLKGNIPLFDCPDKVMEEIYYFRWWTYRKHIKRTPSR